MVDTKDHCDIVPLFDNCTSESRIEEQILRVGKAVGASFGQSDDDMRSFVKGI